MSPRAIPPLRFNPVGMTVIFNFKRSNFWTTKKPSLRWIVFQENYTKTNLSQLTAKKAKKEKLVVFDLIHIYLINN